jgi:tryptophanyl-tRNA synthetase
MDLADPTGKMGKSSASDLGLIYLLDAPDVVRRKVSRAVTDTDTEVAYDPDRRPGVANLLEILAACEDAQPTVVATRFASYADLKEAVSEAIVDILRPVRHRYDEIVAQSATLAEPTNVAGSDFLDMVRRSGAERARERASRTVRRAKYAIGLST